MDVRRQAGALGAVVTGVDIADVDDATFAALHTALMDHLVICLKGQADATPDDQVAFTARWGRIEPHPYVPPIEGHPEIIEIYDPNPITVTWHSDFTYAKQPPSVSLLLGRIIPPVGGDTMFSNGYLAYEGLSDGLRDTVDHLRAVHYATQLAIDSGMPEDEIVERAPGRDHAPRDRAAGAVRQRQLHEALRRVVGGRQPTAARPPLRAVRQARAHVAAPVGGGRPPHLGQPLRAALGGRRHRRSRAAHCTAPPSPERHLFREAPHDRHPLDRQPRRPRRRTRRRLDLAPARRSTATSARTS